MTEVELRAEVIILRVQKDTLDKIACARLSRSVKVEKELIEVSKKTGCTKWWSHQLTKWARMLGVPD